MTPSVSAPGLYVHIPFCLSKCAYCDFYSETALNRIDDYLAALRNEMALYSGRFGVFDTIYIGGGTPSVLSLDTFDEIFDGIADNFTIAASAEITVETNPGDVTELLCRKLQDQGVTRITIGIQSFDDTVLSFLGRRHNAREGRQALAAARKAGFRSVCVDLIFGVPGQSRQSWLEILSEIVSYVPDHLSCYQLTIEPGTPLEARLRRGDFEPVDDDMVTTLFFDTSSFLQQQGYEHYEVSNFARGDGHRSRHNQKYWRHAPYLGLGPSAHSFQGRSRWSNHGSLQDYCRACMTGRCPVSDRETLTSEQYCLEAFALGLRTSDGIDCDAVTELCGPAFIEGKRSVINALIKEGLLVMDGHRLRPTVRGLAVADSLAVM